MQLKASLSLAFNYLELSLSTFQSYMPDQIQKS